MAENDKILENYFLAIHKIISRGAHIAVKGARKFVDTGFPGEDEKQGYLNYLKGLILMFDSHHLTEDEIAFPYFQENLPETHFEWLHEDHDLITGFIEELEPLVEALEGENDLSGNLEKLLTVLEKIDDRWVQHLNLEVGEFVNQIDGLASYEERVDLLKKFYAFSESLIQPYYLSLPFMQFNLEAADRQNWIGGFSPELVDKLESEEWIEKYQSMEPFFVGGKLS
jgi:hypothetical protein